MLMANWGRIRYRQGGGEQQPSCSREDAVDGDHRLMEGGRSPSRRLGTFAASFKGVDCFPLALALQIIEWRIWIVRHRGLASDAQVQHQYIFTCGSKKTLVTDEASLQDVAIDDSR